MRSGTLAVALGLSALLTWVPPITLVVGRVVCADVPARIPVHWSMSGQVDTWASSSLAFWFCLIPGVIGALVVTLLVISNGRDIPRIKGSLGLGAISAVTGGICLAWFTFALAASPAENPTPPAVPLLAGIGWGVVVFAVAAISPRD